MIIFCVVAVQLGSIKWGIDSRGKIKSNRRTTRASEACPHPIERTVHVESHAGESITGDLMTKAW